MKKIILTLIFSVILISSINYVFAQNYEDPLVILETTQGEIIIEFFSTDAAKHTENFLFYPLFHILNTMHYPNLSLQN